MNPTNEEWRQQAACAQIGWTDLWYPEKGGSTRQAKRICNGDNNTTPPCPARDECLTYALTNNEQWGVWGGMSERERHHLRRQPSTAAPAAEQQQVAA